MARLFQNFISGTTDTTLTDVDTTLSGAFLADLVPVVAGDHIALTLDPEEAVGDPEIVWVTAHTASATTATIERAKEGTIARAHDSGSKVVAGVTTQDLAPLGPVAFGEDTSAGEEGFSSTIPYEPASLEVTFTAVTGRLYRLTGFLARLSIHDDGTGDTFTAVIVPDSPIGNYGVGRFQIILPPAAAEWSQVVYGSVVTELSAGSRTLQLSARITGGSTFDVLGASLAPKAYILVEDIGAA